MPTVAVLGAGGPAGVNVCRALKQAGHRVVGLDGNRLHLIWAQDWCDEVRVAPPFGDNLLALLQSISPDLVHSQPEQGVVWLADDGNPLPSYVPAARVIERTQDKLAAAALWAQTDLRRHNPVPVRDPLPDHLHLAADLHGLPFWLRAGRGAGARGATLVEDIRTGFHWVRYWQTRNSDMEWLAEEYLPGRDFCWSGLYRDGELICSFARERLEWIYPHLAPSGRTGTPSISVVVHDRRVNETARAAVEVIDAEPRGLFMVDMREDRDGVPRPTEINAGRFATTTPLYSALGVNMADLYVKAALGQSVEPLGENVYSEGMALFRHIDAGAHFAPMDRLPW